ncbi:hypothetical protein DYH09_21065 [bacterium CPR1]|nr:hypothetical protein [bacterium CPR1]
MSAHLETLWIEGLQLRGSIEANVSFWLWPTTELSIDPTTLVVRTATLSSDRAPGIDWLAFSPDCTRLVFAATEYVLSNTGTMTTQATLRVLSLDSGEVNTLPWDFGSAFITGLDWRDPQPLGDDAG